MERRTALAYAAATAGTVLAGGTALAATTGFLGSDHPAPAKVEDISAVEDATTTTLPEPTVVTIVVEDPALAPAAVDDNGGDRPAGASDDSPDLVDDNGGDRPAGVSDDDADELDDHGDDDGAVDDHGDDGVEVEQHDAFDDHGVDDD